VISGRKEDAVGQPLIYSTSKSFMDYFGINSADDLPKISEVMMEELVNATNVIQAQTEQLEYESDVANGTPMEREVVVADEEVVITLEPEEQTVLTVVQEDIEIAEDTIENTNKKDEA
jgi:segregation and condensation protein B